MEWIKTLSEVLLALAAFAVIAERLYIRSADKKAERDKRRDIVDQSFRDAVAKYLVDEEDKYLVQMETILGNLCMYNTINELRDLRWENHSKFEERIKQLARNGFYK